MRFIHSRKASLINTDFQLCKPPKEISAVPPGKASNIPEGMQGGDQYIGQRCAAVLGLRSVQGKMRRKCITQTPEMRASAYKSSNVANSTQLHVRAPCYTCSVEPPVQQCRSIPTNRSRAALHSTAPGLNSRRHVSACGTGDGFSLL